MDVYTQLQEKLEDLSSRFAHESRYFQVCAPPEAVSGEEVHVPADLPPFAETAESLAERAHLSAHAIVAINLQMEALLESLPPAEGEAEQLAVIEQLSRENQAAGAALTAERGRVESLLQAVRAHAASIAQRTDNPAAPRPQPFPPWYPRAPPSDAPPPPGAGATAGAGGAAAAAPFSDVPLAAAAAAAAGGGRAAADGAGGGGGAGPPGTGQAAATAATVAAAPGGGVYVKAEPGSGARSDGGAAGGVAVGVGAAGDGAAGGGVAVKLEDGDRVVTD